MVGHKHDTDYPGHCLVNLPDPGYCARFSDLACVPIFKLIHQQDSTLNEQWVVDRISANYFRSQNFSRDNVIRLVEIN